MAEGHGPCIQVTELICAPSGMLEFPDTLLRDTGHCQGKLRSGCQLHTTYMRIEPRHLPY